MASMHDQDALLDRAPEAAVRMLALALLDDATTAAQHLRSDEHVEALHDFRVSLRRLRTLLKAYRESFVDSVSKKQTRALRSLADDTGGARDAEVQLEWLASQRDDLAPAAEKAWSWMVRRLEARRDAAYSTVRGDVLERFFELRTRLGRSLPGYRTTVAPEAPSPTFARVVGDRVRSTGTELVSALGEVRAASDVVEAHRARLLGKRLRYIIEPLQSTRLQEPAESLVRSIKAMQDVLGKLHDLHMLAGEIAASLVDAAADHARGLHEALYSGASAASVEDPTSGILVIDRLVRDRVEDLFQELRIGWSRERLAAFSDEVQALAAALYLRGSCARKRRFLLASLPALPGRPLEITQGWIPGLRLQEHLKRVVSGGEEHFYVVKNGTERELEEEANRVVFERLWSLTEGRQLQKRSYRIAEGDRIWEIDDFLDRDLLIARTDLQGSPEQTELPDWLQPHVVREITGEDSLLDENLARSSARTLEAHTLRIQ